MKYYKVSLDLPIEEYIFSSKENNIVGHRILIPWKDEIKIGLVTEEIEYCNECQEILYICDEYPYVSLEWINFINFISRQQSLASGLFWRDFTNIIFKQKFKHQIKIIEDTNLDKLRDFLKELNIFLPKETENLPDLEFKNADKFNPKIITILRNEGLIDEKFEMLYPQNIFIKINEDNIVNADEKQKIALSYLKNNNITSIKSWSEKSKFSIYFLSKLIKNNFAIYKKENKNFKFKQEKYIKEKFENNLLEDKQFCLNGGKFKDRINILKGKIQEYINNEQSIIIIAPEKEKIKEIYKELGGLSKNNILYLEDNQDRKLQLWQNTINKTGIIFGLYQALSLPLKNLACIIVFDDNNYAYKLMHGTKLWIPDFIKQFANFTNKDIIFTSIVPTIENMFLPSVELKPPKLRFLHIDYSLDTNDKTGIFANERFLKQINYPISQDLFNLIKQIEQKNKQAVILASRKGFSALTICKNCNYIPKCQNCSTSLRFYADQQKLVCNKCKFSMPVPSKCPKCGDDNFSRKGPGTEWLQQNIKHLTKLPVYRFDKDHKDNLKNIYEGRAGIIVATSTILSEKAPPELIMVSIALADNWLNFVDFRTEEKYHSMLWNIAEWHPNRSPLIVIQSFLEQNIIKDMQKGLKTFLKKELKIRKMFFYPPFSKIIKITVQYRTEKKAKEIATKLANELQELIKIQKLEDKMIVSDANPNIIEKIKEEFIYNIIIQAKNNTDLGNVFYLCKKYRAKIDINPR